MKVFIKVKHFCVRQYRFIILIGFLCYAVHIFLTVNIFYQKSRHLLNQDTNLLHDILVQSAYRKQNGVKQSGGCRSNYSFLNADIFIEQYKNRSDLKGSIYEVDKVRPYLRFLSTINTHKRKGKSLVRFKQMNGTEPWEVFLQNINQNYLYHPDDPSVDQVIKNMNTRAVTKIVSNPGSTHLVLKLSFEDGSSGVFKTIRTLWDEEPSPNIYYFREFERPRAEIATFHLDKVLGFYRTPPTVSRILNISRDIAPFAQQDLTDTIHRSPVGNLCFYGKCNDYCSLHSPICGDPDSIVGSVSLFLSGTSINELYSRWYRQFEIPPKHKARWEYDDTYCDTDIRPNQNITMRELLNYMDLAVLDFFTGNLDRHHVDSFGDFGHDTFFIHFDNGRGFGRSKYDCMSCIAPVRQCCLIRLSTLSKLVKLYIGPDSLSHVLRESLNSDPIAPVLWEPHLDALDRRLGKVLGVVSDCINVKGKKWRDVIIDDGLN